MQIPVEAIIGAVTVIGGTMLVFHRLGLWSFGKSENGDQFSKESCDANHEKLAHEIKIRDEKYEIMLHENHTTQQLILQRLEQTEKRFEAGNNSFEKLDTNLARLYEITQAQNTSIALLNQSMQQFDTRVCSLERYKNGGK